MPTNWYHHSPLSIELGKGPTKHEELCSSTPHWQSLWIAGFTAQMGKLIKLLIDDERCEVPPEWRNDWVLFLSIEAASWFELLVDIVQDEIGTINDVDGIRPAMIAWAKRHATLQPLGDAVSGGMKVLNYYRREMTTGSDTEGTLHG